VVRWFPILKIWLCFIACCTHGYAQLIEVSPTSNTDLLLESLFTGNNCIEISNSSSAINGSVNGINSYGTFALGTSDFPFESGIVLSTGSVLDINDVTATESMSAGDISWPTATDIEEYLGIEQTLNATSIEFQMSSASDQITFNYILASDEYQQEYPCNFADLFVILVERTDGSEPVRNIAVLPESGNLISTSTIHPEIEGFCGAENEAYFEGYNNGDTNFKARTVPLTASAQVVPGEDYTIKLIIADDIDERFDSAVFIESIGNNSSLDLGPDIEACGTTASLNAEIGNNLAEYTWFQDGVLIPGEIGPTLQVTASGEYTVSVSIPFQGANCEFSDSIQVEVIPFVPAPEISGLIVCDDSSNDGTESIDLSIKNDEILSLLPETPASYAISYFTSEEDALSNENEITGMYQNTEPAETIYVRIESSDGSCLQVGNFELTIGNQIQPSGFTIQICNGLFREGFYFEEISFFDPWVIEFQNGVDVQFYLSEENALVGENEILLSSDIPEGTDFIFAKAIVNTTLCESLFPVDIDFVEPPGSDDDFYVIDLCKNPDIPFQSFTLENILDEVEQTIPGATVVFFPSEEDALAEQNQYFNPFGPIIINNQIPHLQVVYMSIINTNQSTCPRVSPLELHTNLAFNVVDSSTEINRCDDASGDGQEQFLVADVISEIKGKYSQVNIELYETEEDMIDDTNVLPLNSEITVNGSKEVYVAATHLECTYFSPITLKVNPYLNLTPTSLNYCGVANSSGATTLFVTELEETAKQGIENATVQFYENEQDALDEINEIESSIDFNGSQLILYTKVTNLETNCSDITTMQVTVSDPITITDPQPLIYCGELKNGTYETDLTQVLPELGIDLNNFDIGFYESLETAETKTDEIINPENFVSSSQTIFIRIEYPFIGCAVFASFELNIYEQPIIPEIDSFRNCESSGTQNAEFIFSQKDSDVLNGQEGMLVSYYETELDAINGSNEINKELPYTNSSNPQTIYVRLENENRPDCVAIGSFDIEVKPAVFFNTPSSIFACDTNENGQVLVDFNEKAEEILNSGPTDQFVQFYASQEDAESATNSLPFDYTNSMNPEVIFARIENSEGCFEVVTFAINVLELPKTNDGQTLRVCDSGDPDQRWDLTDVELDILDGRQYNIGFEYYESESALLSGNDMISDPENYNNLNDLNSLFVKVINRSTGCFQSVEFDLEIQNGPQLSGFTTLEVCENEANEVLLEEIEALLRAPDDLGTEFKFYLNLQNANQDINPLESVFNYEGDEDIVYVRAVNPMTGCFTVTSVNIAVIPSPPAVTPPDMEACDDDLDGLFAFNFSEQASIILDGLNQEEYTVTFYASESDATIVANELPSTYFGSDGETIFARLQQTRTGCYSIVSFELIVNRKPYLEIPTQFLCQNEAPLIVTADTGYSTDNYVWSNGAIGNTTEIFETGSFWVEVTTESGCLSRIDFEVTESETPVITELRVSNFSDPNAIEVLVIGNGNYLYQLDFGEIQESNVFPDVPIGLRTITVYDSNGCSAVSETVLVMDAPKFFTPNGDGTHDLWHIPGMDQYPGSEIKIFDRAGKLLTVLTTDSDGWDGIYNGQPLPATDYWFSAILFFEEGPYELNGHFALKR
jgi:gliding motility-associated-like protein